MSKAIRLRKKLWIPMTLLVFLISFWYFFHLDDNWNIYPKNLLCYKRNIILCQVFACTKRWVAHVNLQEYVRFPDFGGVHITYYLGLYVVFCEILFAFFPIVFAVACLCQYEGKLKIRSRRSSLCSIFNRRVTYNSVTPWLVGSWTLGCYQYIFERIT